MIKIGQPHGVSVLVMCNHIRPSLSNFEGLAGSCYPKPIEEIHAAMI